MYWFLGPKVPHRITLVLTPKTLASLFPTNATKDELHEEIISDNINFDASIASTSSMVLSIMARPAPTHRISGFQMRGIIYRYH
jgi:hypothetical protein